MGADVILFWIVVAMLFLVGLPSIRRSVSLPMEMELVEIPFAELPEAVQEHFSNLDRELANLRYFPALNFRVPNLDNNNAVRLYLHDGGRSFCLANTLSMATPEGHVGHNFQEFIDEFSDGFSLTTRNSEVDSLFYPVPTKKVLDFPGVSPAELYQHHRQAVAATSKESKVWADSAAILARGREGHQEVMEFQRTHGLLEPDPEAGIYRATYRLGLRGIVQFLNPGSGNFTWIRFLAVTGVAFSICLAGLPALERYLLQVFWQDPSRALLMDLAGKGLLFGSIGAMVGGCFPGKTFIWSFLVSYLPRAVTGTGSGGYFVWCLWAGFVAERVSQRRLASQDLHGSSGLESR